MNKKEEKIKNKIVDELIALDLPLNGNYFEYWLTLLIAFKNNKIKNFNMYKGYDYLASKFKTTTSRVERVLRYGTSFMKKTLKEKYNVNTKITNETIVRFFMFRVF